MSIIQILIMSEKEKKRKARSGDAFIITPCLFWQLLFSILDNTCTHYLIPHVKKID